MPMYVCIRYTRIDFVNSRCSIYCAMYIHLYVNCYRCISNGMTYNGRFDAKAIRIIENGSMRCPSLTLMCKSYNMRAGIKQDLCQSLCEVTNKLFFFVIYYV